MGWDSNPRCACAHAGFQDRCLQPLGHPSAKPGSPISGAAGRQCAKGAKETAGSAPMSAAQGVLPSRKRIQWLRFASSSGGASPTLPAGRPAGISIDERAGLVWSRGTAQTAHVLAACAATRFPCAPRREAPPDPARRSVYVTAPRTNLFSYNLCSCSDYARGDEKP